MHAQIPPGPFFLCMLPSPVLSSEALGKLMPCGNIRECRSWLLYLIQQGTYIMATEKPSQKNRKRKPSRIVASDGVGLAGL